jgi:S-DNA-T family DNA segregation ATPase FtsK/SpoIIIE
MATRRRKRKKKTNFLLFGNFNAKDERWPKIIGTLCILFAIYLTIAFTSYFFTWKFDQDKVLEFSWQMLLRGDLVVDNWLGRLGALVANMFFYWGFGLPSVFVVVLLAHLGYSLLRKQNLQPTYRLFQYLLVATVFLSISLEFAFRNSGFSWGGAFGEATYLWMKNFVGQIGLLLFLVFAMGGIFIWLFNPKFETIHLSTGFSQIKLPSFSFNHKFVSSSLKTNRKNTSKKYKGFDEVSEGQRNPHETVVPKDVAENMLDFEVKSEVSSKTAKNKDEDDIAFEIEEKIIVAESSGDSVDSSFNLVETKPDTEKLIIQEESEIISEPYDPRKDLSHYKFPTEELLEDYGNSNLSIDRAELESNKDQIINTLRNYKIEITKIRATIGPTVTLYEIVPAPGIKISKIKSLENDIALSLAALGIRIIAPIPGKGTIGIEVPNKNKQTVGLKELIRSDRFKKAKMDLPIAIGKTIANEVFIADLAKMPHLMVAGATGQGKSVGINSIIVSLLYKKHPSEVKFVMIDPKKVELFPFNGLENHFLSFLPDEEEAIVTETEKVVYTLNSLMIEMDNRYNLLKKAKARNIKEYNVKFKDRRLNPKEGHRFFPYLILVIDEFADLIMTAGKEVELPIARLAQLSRAVGIHLILATQRPSVNIITGVIKANFPARIAYKVTAKVDSRTILDTQGAEQLIGRGDLLLSVGGSNIVRLQGAFVDTPEIDRIVKHIEHQQGYPEPFLLPEYRTDEDGPGSEGIRYDDLDSMFEQAARMIVLEQYGSTSLLQRKMQIGYNRAGRLMDQLEAIGIVGAANGSKPRDVLVFSEQELENMIAVLKSK